MSEPTEGWDGAERRRTPEEAIDELREGLISELTGWRRWLPASIAGVITATIVVAIAMLLIQSANDALVKNTVHEARAALAEGQRQGCGPNNVRQAQDTKIVGDNLAHLKAIYAAPRRILWCEKTYTPTNNGQTRIFLPDGLQECFQVLAITGYFEHKKPFTDPARLRKLKPKPCRER